VIVELPGGTKLAVEPVDESPSSLATASIAAHVLMRILADEQERAACAQASYVHANGFFKLALGRTQRSALRLHHWDSVGDDDPHDHRWSFHGRVLRGVFREVIYQVSDSMTHEDPDFVEHMFGRTVKDPDAFEITARRPARLDVTSERLLSAGDVHALAPSEVHSFVPISTPALTVVVTGPSSRRLSHVYRALSAASRSEARLDEAPTIARAKAILTMISDAEDGRGDTSSPD
jgi:hypothetical protein